MKEFIEEMRNKANEVYNARKPYFQKKLRSAMIESADKGDTIAMVCVQGCHDARNFERYIGEIGLTCEQSYINESWHWYKVEF